jgi:hypothetical protein
VWVRRGLLAAMLAGATIVPGYTSDSASLQCPGTGCGSYGTIRWIRPLSGSWTAENGIAGTVPAVGQAYVSAGPQVAAIGYGMNVHAYDARTGRRLWTAALTGFPAGASIVSVRSWERVVTAGVGYPDAGTGGTSREEVVLAGQTGRRLRGYPATAYGGAVAADYARTVIVGSRSVTSYRNASGRPAWSRQTGPLPQAWRLQGNSSLLVTVAAGGYLGTAPVTALRKINLGTGAERLIRPPHGSFDGTLSAALDGVALFSGSSGLSAYSEATGRLLWRRPGVVPESEDLPRETLYVYGGSGLTGLNPQTGATRGGSVPAASAVYGVWDSVALGLDQGSGGDAWGYDIAGRRVVWTTPSLPWPHYFVDLSGIGGSADPTSSTILLAACARVGAGTAAGTGQVCLRPELVAINR